MIKPQPARRVRKRVVIVDDSRTMQAMLEQILSARLGFEIVGIAADGEEAFSMIRRLRPDLVTIDLQMPYIDGQELLRKLSVFPDLYKVVISATACSNLAIKASLEKLGADACISKMDMSRDPGVFCDALQAVVSVPKASATIPSTKPAAGISTAGRGTRQMAIGGYPIPADERRRLEALRALDLANDDADHQLDLLTAHMVKTTGFSACAMTFIDEDRQWIKSASGLDRGSMIRSQAFCNYTICGDEPVIVQDATLDPRFCRLEAVLTGPMIRSYVGCPIISSSGVRLGALCLVDSKPRRVTAAELTNLRSIAKIAAEMIESRAASLRRAA